MIGKLENGKIVPFPTSVNVPVLIVLEGEHTIYSAIRSAHYAHKVSTWSYRFVGWLLLFFAITCLSSLLHLLRKTIFFFLMNNERRLCNIFLCFSISESSSPVNHTKSYKSSNRKFSSIFVDCIAYNINCLDISSSMVWL